MRLFVALDIEPEIRKRIAEFGQQMRAYAPDVRWVSPETFHITVQFLGETHIVEEIHAALHQAHPAVIPMAFRGTGFFPNANSPRVLWVGIESDERLQRLADAIGDVLQPLGFQREGGPFTPHLTLARSGSGRRKRVRGEHASAGLRALRVKLEGVPAIDFGTMTAREFCLYQSTLSPAGATYLKLATFPLG
jgi:RNA 2',3'-cyclic 3'-phosphodiesterase